MPAWIEAIGPTGPELAALEQRFGLHELALEDAVKAGHPPKLEDFGEHLFVIAHTPVPGDDGEPTRKVALFLSKDWLVTVLRTPSPTIEAFLERVRKDPAYYSSTRAFLVHSLLDQLMDAFEVRIDELFDTVEAMEDEILADPSPELMERILDLRRETSALVRTVRAQRDVYQGMQRLVHPVLPKKALPWYRDLYDHAQRVHDLLERVREGLAAARDAYLSAANNRLSETMRVLTIIATTMMPLTLIVGLYGMNFDFMPGIHHPWGFWLIVGAMAMVTLAMLAFFRRRRWL